MRKIDVILLSALMLYDYSAQTLVDSDIISLGSSLITETSSFRENELALTGSQDSENDYDYTVAENTAELSGSNTAEATVKQIRYHDLARMNPATAAVSQLKENESDNIVISMPDALVEEAIMAPKGVVEAQAEENSAFALATVAASSVSLSSFENIEVKSDIDRDDLQFADSDNDGMFNFEDKCPGVAGVARFEGCPVPDSDGDGINDEEDRCPFVQGSDANGGCPAETPIENSLNTDNFHAGISDASVLQSNLAQLEIKDGDILSNRDFNIILQLADKTINNTGAKIDIFKPASDSAAAQTATVVKYLRDLGVKDTQINIATKNTGTNVNQISTGVEIQIRY